MVTIENLKFYRGAYAGLSGKTATLILRFEEQIKEWSLTDDDVRHQVTYLWPQHLLFGIKTEELPHAFLVEPCMEYSLPHWVVALTIAFQRWAGDFAGDGRVLMVSGSSIALALAWEREPVFKNALYFALRYLLLWSASSPVAELPGKLAKEFDEWLLNAQPGGLSPNSLRFACSAWQRKIPVSVSTGSVRLGWGTNALRMDSSFTDATSVIGVRIAHHKFQTSSLLQQNGVPVPSGFMACDRKQAFSGAAKLGWPVVVKPLQQEQGIGVVPGIKDKAIFDQAVDNAFRLSPDGIIVEKHVDGDDHRMLVVGGKLLMATLRIPAGVTGNGISSVEQLVKEVNADQRRGQVKRSILIAIDLNAEAMRCLRDQCLEVESVPETGRFVRLRYTANISTGGSAVDVTDKVHPDNRIVVERATRLIGLDIAGVDFLCTDIAKSWRDIGGKIIEVNSQPGFRPHWLSVPDRDINGEIIDWLFRKKSPRIPVAAITGTNGKTTTSRMLHHIWKTSGKRAGVCTTNGVWVGDDMIADQNLSGYPGGRMLLEDSAVEAAVIEMPRKGLIYFGHPCDRYDVAALLNVQDDHIGVDGINSLGEMGRLKASVLERATQAVVINAEDPLCLAMRYYARAPKHILVARDSSTLALQDHLKLGGAGVFAQKHNGTSWIVLAEGTRQSFLMPLEDIPATMNGLLRVNEINALFAVALAWAQGIPQEIIRKALAIFANTQEQNPGRFNFIEGFEFKVLLDFAHNPDGVRELCQMVSKLHVTGKRRMLNLNIGNRHPVHLKVSAPYLSRTFDHFVLGCDPVYVQKSPEWRGDDPINKMLEYSQACLLKEGVSQESITIERNHSDAVKRIIADARPGDLLVLLAGEWEVLPFLEQE